jgi:hypothetical protein
LSENKENIVRVTLEEARRMKGETDYAHPDAITDEDIARTVAENPDAAPVDAGWSGAGRTMPAGIPHKFMSVDENVVDWFRAAADDYRAGHAGSAVRPYGGASRPAGRGRYRTAPRRRPARPFRSPRVRRLAQCAAGFAEPAASAAVGAASPCGNDTSST